MNQAKNKVSLGGGEASEVEVGSGEPATAAVEEPVEEEPVAAEAKVDAEVAPEVAGIEEASDDKSPEDLLSEFEKMLG